LTEEIDARLAEHVAAWGLDVEKTTVTATSVIAYVTRAGRPAVLKVARWAGDERRCGEIAAAFGGRGVVSVYEHVDGAALLERLSPGEPLAALALSGRDDEATDILATLLGRMSPGDAPPACATAESWGAGFARYLASGDAQIPSSIVEHAQAVYAELAAAQRNPALLHGDLQHYNVLLDDVRGWLAIDPKGVVAELEYELGAALRNPWERPEVFASLHAVERRLGRFRDALGIDVDRARAWTFAQGVLSAIWSVEDGHGVDSRHPGLLIANVIRESSAFRADFGA